MVSEHEHEVDAGRCPYVNDFYRHPAARMREDGWRCGREVDHTSGHTLYSADGERVLDVMGPWSLPARRVNPPTTHPTDRGASA